MKPDLTNKVTDELPVAILAESDEETRMLIRSLLELLGFIVISSSNEYDLFDFVVLYQPELIVIELRSPIIASASTIRKIRIEAGLANVPVIGLAPEQLSKTKHALVAGCSAYVAKPVELEQLEEIIESLIPCNRLSLVSFMVH